MLICKYEINIDVLSFKYQKRPYIFKTEVFLQSTLNRALLKSFPFFCSNSVTQQVSYASLHLWPAKSLQSCPTLCDLLDYSPLGSSVHGILQAVILEWVAMFSTMGSSWPRGWTSVCCGSYITGRFFITETLGKTNGSK